MKRISIRAHLLTLMVSWMAALSIVAFFAISGLRVDRGAVIDLAQNHMPSIQALQVMKEAYTAIRLNNLTTAVYENFDRAATPIRKVLKNRESIWGVFSRGWHAYEALPRDENEDRLWNDFKKAHEDYQAAEGQTAQRMTELAKGDYGRERQRTLFREFYRRFRKAEDPVAKAKSALDELVLLNLDAGKAKAQAAMAAQARNLRNISWVTLLAGAFSLIFGSILILRIFQDLEERNRLEEALKLAVETRDEFLSVASHDLKNALTALGLRVDVLNKSLVKSQDRPSEPVLALGRDASRLLGRIAQMLDQLLDITRIRIGSLQLETKELDLRSLLIEMIDNVRESAEKQGSSISLKAPHPVLGTYDPVRIHQIVSNLISNAIKYGKGGPIEVTLDPDAKSRVVRLKVKDRGPGIPPELQARIFEQFHRASSDSHIEGLGLGLYIVRKIVAAHGGSISVNSVPGSGAEFTVELPMNVETEPKAA